MTATVPGYRGIWFALGQVSEYGDKYSGGLGTYTSYHSPIAVYASAVNKTFFTYGGVAASDSNELLVMASEYDHSRHLVPQPAVVCRKEGVDDPHDNASIAVDDDGFVWVFVSGRGRRRPGIVYRSDTPYSTRSFARVATLEMTYPQPRYIPGTGMVTLFTKYTAGRELYWACGGGWTSDHKLAGFGGHYQVSAERDGALVTAFDYHPDGDVDRRTNLYVLRSDDHGSTWGTVDGTPVECPLAHPDNPALVLDERAHGRLNYVKDVAIDVDGRPIVLHVTSYGYEPGPAGSPRTWTITAWDGHRWRSNKITTSDHNYDSGSLYLDDDRWTVIGPTAPGPQKWQTGGEITIWRSADRGHTWEATPVTSNSPVNHTYVRRPAFARDPFIAMWADGNPLHRSPSHLYFGDSHGRYYQLPYDMHTAEATPIVFPRRS